MRAMDYTKLGKTNIKISKIGIGTWQWGSKSWGYGESYFKEDLEKAFRAAVDGGINFFDTAEVYGGGESEKLLGEFSRDLRENIIIASKVLPNHLTYKGVMKAIKNSLARLKTDYIDLYYVHWPNPIIPMSWTARAFNELYESGLIRAIGVSNFGLKRLIKFDELTDGKVSADQVKYSLLKRDAEKRLLKYCLSNDITLVAYSPLDQGAVLGKYNEKELPKDIWRRISIIFTPINMRKITPLIETLHEIAQEKGVKPINIVLRYLIEKGAVPIVGVKKEEHVKDLLKTFDFNLGKNEINKIDLILRDIKLSKVRATLEAIRRIIKP